MPPSYAVLLGANEVPGLTPTGDRPTLNSIPVPLPSVFLMRSGWLQPAWWGYPWARRRGSRAQM